MLWKTLIDSTHAPFAVPPSSIELGDTGVSGTGVSAPQAWIGLDRFLDELSGTERGPTQDELVELDCSVSKGQSPRQNAPPQTESMSEGLERDILTNNGRGSQENRQGCGNCFQTEK